MRGITTILHQDTPPVFTAKVYTGDWISTEGHAGNVVVGILFANQPSADGGFEIQQSNDGNNADYSTQFTVAATSNPEDAKAFRIDRVAPYIRVVWTSASTDPTVWRLGLHVRSD